MGKGDSHILRLGDKEEFEQLFERPKKKEGFGPPCCSTEPKSIGTLGINNQRLREFYFHYFNMKKNAAQGSSETLEWRF